MAMDTIFATLVLYLLALSPKIKTTESLSSTTSIHKRETVTQFNATVHTTVTLNLTEVTTPFTSTNGNNETTLTTTDRTRPLETSQSTTIMATLSKSASPTATTPGTHTLTSTAHTNSTMHTTEGFISASATTVIITNSSHTVNTIFHSLDSTTQALQLNTSERITTTLFSVILGVLAMTLFAFAFHKCRQKTQYLHQPLNNSDTDAFLADDDTLVISGGLYDGHPIYDNVPSASAHHSQFSLEFLH